MKKGEKGFITSPDTERPQRVPPGQRVTQRFPILHEGEVPAFDPEKWRFTITGLVEKERALTYDEFMALPQVEVFSDIHCVTGWSKLENAWVGVASKEIGKLVDIKPEARFVLVHDHAFYSANLSLDDFFQEDVLFATEHNGEAITPGHGGPVRLIVPRLYLWKSVKWASEVEFIAEEVAGYWEQRGYHIRGDPWKEERYSH